MLNGDLQGQKNTSRRAVVFLIAASFFCFGFVAGQWDAGKKASADQSTTGTVAIVSGLQSKPPSDVHLDADFQQFWDLWRELKTRYYKQPVDDTTLFYGAMSGLASSLGDPYTVFFEPKVAEEFSQSLQGKFEGIGAEIGIKDDQLQVIAPLPDNPAAKAGILAGDLILEIDGQDTMNMSVDKAVYLIRGAKGTVVNLRIGRVKTVKDAKGKERSELNTLEVPITRDVIVVKSVNVAYLENNIAKIEINHFNQDTNDLFTKAITEVLSKDVKGIVLDLRNNPGGYLDGATYVASEWVGDDIVVVERQRGEITDSFHGTGKARVRGVPTVVLVNQGSASASEIVAGALQDYGLAKLVGMKTFGKGSVQDYTEFKDTSAYKITIAEWLTPKGRSIDKEGIMPDTVIDVTVEDHNANRDPQLDKAIEILGGAPAAPQSVSATSTKK